MTALLLVLTALLIALNGSSSWASTRWCARGGPRLEAMRDEGLRGAALALHEIEEIGDYISTVQVGITMTSIGIGALGEPVLADLFEPWFGNVVGHGLAVAISVMIAYLIITSAHIVAGELVPKLYAIDRAEGVARRVAAPLRFFRRLFAPFIFVLTGVSNRILRWIGVDPDRVAQEGQHARGAQGADRDLGHARPGRGGDARPASSTCTSRRRARS